LFRFPWLMFGFHIPFFLDGGTLPGQKLLNLNFFDLIRLIYLERFRQIQQSLY
jgi:hypothetical protein